MSLPKHKVQKSTSVTVKKVKKVKEKKSHNHGLSKGATGQDLHKIPATGVISNNDDCTNDVIPEPLRDAVINFDMIVRRNLAPGIQDSSHDEIINAVHSISHLRLDRENISVIDNLEMLGSKVTNVYLQQNRIRHIDNLEFLQNLEFLTMSENLIEKLENLSSMQNLKFLDLSNNRIEKCKTDELPKSLIILSLYGNPCTKQDNYRHDVISALPMLKHLDGAPLSKELRRVAGHLVSDDEEDGLVSDDDDTGVDEIAGGDGEFSSGGLDNYMVSASRDQSSVFQDLTADMHQRCKLRMLETDAEHQQRKQILAQIREGLKTK